MDHAWTFDAAGTQDTQRQASGHPGGIRGVKRSALMLAMAASMILAAPASAAISVHFTYLTTPIHRGADATASVHTAAHASCHITVTYSSGPSHAHGLGHKYASSAGNVSWTWTIGPSTTPGYWPVKVSCSKGGHSDSATRKIHVVR